jgi:tRNA-splicing ligase RtcB
MNNIKKEIFDYSLNLDNETKKQFLECFNNDFVLLGALMPDAHKGYVAPIGSVFLTREKIVPSWVGFDIGCGMATYKLKSKKLREKEILEKIKENKKKILNICIKEIPMGKNKVSLEKKVSRNSKSKFKKILEELKKTEYDSEIYNIIKSKGISNLGSLGSGNHFIEIGESKKNKSTYIIIHSGSRNVGKQVASFYMKKAANENIDIEKSYPLSSNENYGKKYLNVLKFLLDYAILNREEISTSILNILKNELDDETLELELFTNKNHNHIEIVNSKDFGFNFEEKLFLHRKGATPSKKNEFGVIPANMKDGSFLVKGKGNIKFLFSSSHGAGRIYSRSKAKKAFTLEEFSKEMKGICARIEEEFIDEAPFVYKNINQVMELQKDSVEIIDKIKPIINLKG